MRLRYRGPLDVAELAIPGACLTFPNGEWIDATEAAEAAYVPARHLEIVVAGLGPDWETDDRKPDPKAKSKAADAADEEGTA